MLQLRDKWVWDFWFAVDGSDYHIFYLQADKSLGNPDLRHWNVSVGHAVSCDLIHWDILPDALAPTANNDEAPDSFTTWTGSVVRYQNEWLMFYTGTMRAEKGLIQRVCLARSTDLIHWVKEKQNPIVQLDERWYDGLKLAYWHDASWRDPWILFDKDQNGNDLFHMLITCRVNRGAPDGRGAIGYASSSNLVDWQVGDAFLAPGWYGEMEVPQVQYIDGRYYLFCSVSTRFHSALHNEHLDVIPQTGIKYFVSEQLLGPYETLGNSFLTRPEQNGLYAGRVIQGPDGKWYFMAFLGNDSGGEFQGVIIDPIPIAIAADGSLSLASLAT